VSRRGQLKAARISGKGAVRIYGTRIGRAKWGVREILSYSLAPSQFRLRSGGRWTNLELDPRHVCRNWFRRAIDCARFYGHAIYACLLQLADTDDPSHLLQPVQLNCFRGSEGRHFTRATPPFAIVECERKVKRLAVAERCNSEHVPRLSSRKADCVAIRSAITDGNAQVHGLTCKEHKHRLRPFRVHVAGILRQVDG
jgi:hypothetical protein